MLQHLSQLLYTEYLKFKNYAVTSFLFWMGMAMFPLALILLKSSINELPPPLPSTSIIYEFPTIWDYEGYVGNWIVFFFFGCMVIFSVTSETSFRTERQNVLTGYTRQDYYLSKALTVFALSLLATVVYTICCLVFGSINTADVYYGLMFDNNWAMLRFFLMSLGYLSFAMLVGFWFRKSGLALFIYLAYTLVLEYVGRGLTYYLLYKAGIDDKSAISWWPLNAIEDNMPFPLFRIENFVKSSDMPFAILMDYKLAAILTMAYSTLFFYLAYRSLVKRDM